MPKNAAAWTPYGLEHIRIAYLRRRRIIAILALLLLLGLLLLLFSQTTEKSTQIFANGNEVGANGIQIQDNRDDSNKNDHVTVRVEPGQVTRADTGNNVTGSAVTRASLPVQDRAAPYNWNYYLLTYGPYLLIALAAWLLAKRRGKYDQVNFGVYKGAMPLEMLTASHDRHVFTKKRATTSVFGKGRVDYLPREIVLIEPVQEEAEQ